MSEGQEQPDLGAALRTGTAWDVPMFTGRAGTGNWEAYRSGLDPVYAAADRWRAAIRDVRRPWLCWNIDDEWCSVQQRLVQAVGWTPVIGWDPNSCPPRRTVLPGSVEIDFNEGFAFPALWPHFPMEFAFLWTERLAFWHADLLVRTEKLRRLADMFGSLPDGEMAAVRAPGSMRAVFRLKQRRYWELIGCVTRGASRDQFEKGCGWWRHFYCHPNTPPAEATKRRAYYYDSGVGIMYWKRHCGGRVHDIPQRLVDEGHCTQVGRKNYRKGNNKSEELRLNFDLPSVARRLGLESYL
jgi:hypothetical protein